MRDLRKLDIDFLLGLAALLVSTHNRNMLWKYIFLSLAQIIGTRGGSVWKETTACWIIARFHPARWLMKFDSISI